MIKSSEDAGDVAELSTLRSIAGDLNRRAVELRAILERVPDPIE